MFGFSAVGIELSDGAIKAVKLKRRHGRLVVTWADYRQYARPEDGAVRPRAGLPERAIEALKEFVDRAPLSGRDRIYVGLPSVATFSRLIEVPDVGHEQLHQLAEYEIHKALRGPTEDYVIARSVLREGRPRAQPGRHAQALCMLFAVRRNLRDAFVSDLARCGLEFDNLLPAPAALAHFVRYDRPHRGDRIVVSIGLNATEVTYMRERGYAFRTLPLGCVGLTAIPADAASRRKAAADRLVDRIAAEIGAGAKFFFGKDATAFSPSYVTLLGEGAVTPEIVEQFRRHYGDLIEPIGSLHRLEIEASVEGDARRHVAQMGKALGLAIAGSRADQPELELLPPNPARATARRFSLLATAALLIGGAAVAMAHFARTEAAALPDAEAPDRGGELRALRDRGTELLGEATRLAASEAALARHNAARLERAGLVAKVLAQFGPAVDAFGNLDTRVASLDVAAEDGAPATAIRGKLRVPLADAERAIPIVKSRLGALPRVAGVEVAESERDAAHAVLEFRARQVHE